MVMSQDEILSVLATKSGLANDRNFFIGRKDQIRDIEHACDSGNAVWIHGPRRMGKTALAERVAKYPADKKAQYILVDCGDCAQENSFQYTLDRAIKELRQGSDASGAQNKHDAVFDPDKDYEPEFESAIKSRVSSGQIRLVFDEFDKVAPNMDEQKQLFFRRLNHKHKHTLLFIFISGANPKKLIDETVCESSRLLGVTEVIETPMLTRDEVAECFRRVAKSGERPHLAETHISDYVWSVVGGNAFLVTRLVRKIVDKLWDVKEVPLAALEKTCVSVRFEEEQTIRNWWTDIPVDFRIFISGENAERDTASDEEQRTRVHLRNANFVNEDLPPDMQLCRPQWLGKAGSEQGVHLSPLSSRSREATAREISGVLGSINEQALAKIKCLAFKPSEKIRTDQPFLVPMDKVCFKEAVIHLNCWALEAAKTDPRSGGKWYLAPLPKSLKTYKRSYGCQALTCLRNHYSHDPTLPPPEAIEGNYKNVGEVFKKCCGNELPGTPKEWGKALDGLMNLVHASLTDLLASIKAEETPKTT